MRTLGPLVALVLLLVSGCSNPKDVALTETNRDEVVKQVTESKKLTAEEKRLFVAYMMRATAARALGALFASGATPKLVAVGKTVGQIIDEERQAETQQRAEEEKTARLAAEARAREEALTVGLRKAINLTVYSKSYSPSNPLAGLYQDYINIRCAYENTSGKDIRAFRGKIRFTDLFGQEIFITNLTISDPVKAGAKATWDGAIRYNQFVRGLQALRNTDLKDMKVVWLPSGVIFADGKQIGEE